MIEWSRRQAFATTSVRNDGANWFVLDDILVFGCAEVLDEAIENPFTKYCQLLIRF